MIYPTRADLGRYVVYTDGSPTPTVEAGRISGFDDKVVFVETTIPRAVFTVTRACGRANLYWLDAFPALLAACEAVQRAAGRESSEERFGEAVTDTLGVINEAVIKAKGDHP